MSFWFWNMKMLNIASKKDTSNFMVLEGSMAGVWVSFKFELNILA